MLSLFYVQFFLSRSLVSSYLLFLTGFDPAPGIRARGEENGCRSDDEPGLSGFE